MQLNGTEFAKESSLIFSRDSMTDGDHQLFVVIESLKVNGSIAVDYFECVAPLITFYSRNSALKVSLLLSIENSSGRGFDIISMGSNATSVPTQAVIVDDTSSEIVYQNDTLWHHASDARSLKRSLAVTITDGASLSYSFDGVAIW